ncbi:YbbR-like domain-containing protein [Aquibacillus salsiterrae]|uniref:CdaR family protein n=1 Tax=Aquibacillus salsiterrae TaxID=2950439 RepID=A0A9X3WEV9_9BACI|nr:CdaR family protein [Aquibacillus salsiterrae]MDC3417171.1 CdaR family protein [Aquibacillus salsiterrae]
MDEWLKKPWIIRAISLILALLLFSAVSLDDDNYQSDAALDFISSSAEAQQLKDVPVNIKIDDEKYVVSGVPRTVTVTLEGPNSVVTSTATQRSFDVYIDLEDLQSGTYTVPLKYTGISDSLTVYIEPKEIEVTIEERATAQFGVAVDFINENNITPGYETGETAVEPENVTITSSKSVVDKIAIVKAFVDLQGVDKPIDGVEAPVKVYDRQGNELSVRVEPSAVEVSVDIINPSKVVPIKVETTGELQRDLKIKSINVDPAELRVFATENRLDSLESISTETVDLSNITEDTTTEVELVVPAEIRKMERDKVTVNIKVEKMVERTFNQTLIDIDNLNNEYDLTFLRPADRKVNITVRGPEAEIENLSSDDLNVFIDVKGLQEGQYPLPIEIALPEGITTETDLGQATVQIE